jgi:hypothetical protein
MPPKSCSPRARRRAIMNPITSSSAPVEKAWLTM